MIPDVEYRVSRQFGVVHFEILLIGDVRVLPLGDCVVQRVVIRLACIMEKVLC